MRIEEFAREEQGPALARRVAEDLRAALAAEGRAGLAVPGGTTPAPFLEALAREGLDWSRVRVTLTDERRVPVDHPRSNERLLRAHLLTGAAGAASFVPLDAARIGGAMPLTVCVLGMGDDMHTASLFPGTPGLAALLDPEGEALVASVAPPGADEPRVTLTVRALAGAAHVYLLIKGTEKRAALERAMATDDPAEAPIRAVLDAGRDPVVFHAE